MGIEDAEQVVVGRGHSCAMLSTGGVRCWGLNTDGQLGDDTAMTRTTPVSPSTP
jgi:alpha-tubulin suppressor-like RCC1 family protein